MIEQILNLEIIQSRFGSIGGKLQNLHISNQPIDILLEQLYIQGFQGVFELLLSQFLPFYVCQLGSLVCLFVSLVEFLQDCQILLFQGIVYGSLHCGYVIQTFIGSERLIFHNIAIFLKICLSRPQKFFFLLSNRSLQLIQFPSDIILIFLVLIRPLLRYLLSSVPGSSELPHFLIQLLPILQQKLFDLLDGLSRRLDLVIFVESVDGALRADGSVAAEAEIRELLFLVVWTRVHYLVGCFFGGTAAVARLGDGSRGVVFCLRGCLFEIFGPGLSQRFINPLFGISFVVRVLIRLKISALGFALIRKAGNLAAILLLQPVINPPKFIETRLIKLGLLAALAACIDLDVKRSTGELWGQFSTQWTAAQLTQGSWTQESISICSLGSWHITQGCCDQSCQDIDSNQIIIGEAVY